jgi:hypothetical protein
LKIIEIGDFGRFFRCHFEDYISEKTNVTFTGYIKTVIHPITIKIAPSVGECISLSEGMRQAIFKQRARSAHG